MTSERLRYGHISQNRANPQFAPPPKHKKCLKLPSNEGNFRKSQKKKLENHRHIVTRPIFWHFARGSDLSRGLSVPALPYARNGSC
jgi:predicted nicotinamide N-methyase